MSDSDQDLLHRYLRERDQSAFRMLVERHLAFVHGVARRVTGNAAMAEDVAQQVFVRMARGAGGIPRDLALAAWLHRVTRHLAIDLVRSESRRRTRETRFESSTAMTAPDSSDWKMIAPVIDELVDRLPGKDRDIVLLRYFEGRTHREIACRLGISEEAAKKRSMRALEKLRGMLGHRGIASMGTALATLLPAHACTVAPSSLLSGVLAAGQAAVPGSSLVFNTQHLMTSTQKATVASAALIFLGSAGYALRPASSVDGPNGFTGGGRDQVAVHEHPSKMAERVFAELSAADRMERIRRILAIDDSYERLAETLDFVSWIKPSQFGETLDQVRSFEGVPAAELEKYLLASWAKVEPRGAAEWAMERDAFPEDFFKWWAEVDADEAMDWIMREMPEALGDEWSFRRHLVSLLSMVASKDPSKAVELIGRVTEIGKRERLLVAIGAQLKSEGPDAYEALVATVEAGPERSALIEDGASWMIQNGRALTAHDWFANNEMLRKELRVRDTFRNACIFAPRDVFDQLKLLPDGPLKDEAVAGVCLASVQQIPLNELFDLLEQHPAVNSDEVIGGMIDELPYPDRFRELWRVNDPKYREELQEAALISWATGLPEVVKEWMEEHPVSDVVRARVLEAIEQKREP